MEHRHSFETLVGAEGRFWVYILRTGTTVEVRESKEVSKFVHLSAHKAPGERDRIGSAKELRRAYRCRK